MVNFKKEFSEMPDEFFETLTFGDLKVGQLFIGMPRPGDNQGHGGYKGAKRIFRKTDQEIKEISPGLRYGIPTGRAVNNSGQASDFPYSMPVLLLE